MERILDIITAKMQAAFVDAGYREKRRAVAAGRSRVGGAGFVLFALLEESGYLPRIAFILDGFFKPAGTSGKHALTMLMGFGCNAAGIVGCRIIDSPRERLLAILTNSFVPCNGRFPTIISIITMFFVGSIGGLFSSLFSTVLLTLFITFSIY